MFQPDDREQGTRSLGKEVVYYVLEGTLSMQDNYIGPMRLSPAAQGNLIGPLASSGGKVDLGSLSAHPGEARNSLCVCGRMTSAAYTRATRARASLSVSGR